MSSATPGHPPRDEVPLPRPATAPPSGLDWAEGTPADAVALAPAAAALAPGRGRPRRRGLDDGPTLIRPATRPPAPVAAPTSAPRATAGYCPRCRGPLGRRAVAAIELDECPACHGAFLAADELSMLVFDAASARAVAADLAERPAVPAQPPLVGSCPVCARALAARVVRRLGVCAMACAEHGGWLERGELLRAARVLGRGTIDAPTSTELLAFILS
ncbi:MAG: zf-TFIIB domain-containing protein [Kofleriaceae bacterium]|nr:zf-TFIIB domain-containing protein [Kofleriaceae bacterium]